LDADSHLIGFYPSAKSCEFNRSMQHVILIQKNEVLKNETETKNLLQ